MSEHVMNVEGAVKFLGISRASLYRAVKAKTLRARKLRGRTVFLLSDLKQSLENLPELDTAANGA